MKKVNKKNESLLRSLLQEFCYATVDRIEIIDLPSAPTTTYDTGIRCIFYFKDCNGKIKFGESQCVCFYEKIFTQADKVIALARDITQQTHIYIKTALNGHMTIKEIDKVKTKKFTKRG